MLKFTDNVAKLWQFKQHLRSYDIFFKTMQKDPIPILVVYTTIYAHRKKGPQTFVQTYLGGNLFVDVSDPLGSLCVLIKVFILKIFLKIPPNSIPRHPGRRSTPVQIF